MSEELKILRWIFTLLLVIILSATSCSIHQVNKIADLVESGAATPLGAKCAINSDTGEICMGYLLELENE
jgi:hypothetical protein